jgi:hypothetical protein
MKKIISILFLFAFMITLTMAQSGVTKTFVKGQYFYEYAGTSLDTTTGTWTKDVHIPYISQKVFVNQQFKIHNNGSAKATIRFQGKVFSTDTYTSTDTLFYAGGQDTVINYPITTASPYRYFKIVIERAAGTPKVTWCKYSLKTN